MCMNKGIYNRFALFIIEYIYKNGWNELRPVQIEAARVLFDTDKNLLLSQRHQEKQKLHFFRSYQCFPRRIYRLLTAFI